MDRRWFHTRNPVDVGPLKLFEATNVVMVGEVLAEHDQAVGAQAHRRWPQGGTTSR
jgi:hypothetical protein